MLNVSAASLDCTPETNITLHVNKLEYKLKKKKKDKRWEKESKSQAEQENMIIT